MGSPFGQSDFRGLAISPVHSPNAIPARRPKPSALTLIHYRHLRPTFLGISPSGAYSLLIDLEYLKPNVVGESNSQNGHHRFRHGMDAKSGRFFQA
jgi:hypothetical protein